MSDLPLDLFAAIDSVAVRATEACEGMNLVVPNETFAVHFTLDRGRVGSQAIAVARQAEDHVGYAVRVRISRSAMEEWRQHDWRAGEVDAEAMDGLSVTAEDLPAFSKCFLMPVEVVGIYG